MKIKAPKGTPFLTESMMVGSLKFDFVGEAIPHYFSTLKINVGGEVVVIEAKFAEEVPHVRLLDEITDTGTAHLSHGQITHLLAYARRLEELLKDQAQSVKEDCPTYSIPDKTLESLSLLEVGRLY